jgi:hypothetical protein
MAWQAFTKALLNILRILIYKYIETPICGFWRPVDFYV